MKEIVWPPTVTDPAIDAGEPLAPVVVRATSRSPIRRGTYGGHRAVVAHRRPGTVRAVGDYSDGSGATALRERTAEFGGVGRNTTGQRLLGNRKRITADGKRAGPGHRGRVGVRGERERAGRGSRTTGCYVIQLGPSTVEYPQPASAATVTLTDPVPPPPAWWCPASREPPCSFHRSG